MKIRTALSLLFLLSQSLQGAKEAPKAAIFDLGEVVFGVNRLQVARQHLGVGTILKYLLTCNNPGNMGKKATQLLRDMRNEGAQKVDASTPLVSGEPMPAAFIDWQKGEKTQKELMEEVNGFLDKNPQYFRSGTERSLALGVIAMMFDAPKRVSFTQPISSGVALMHWFKSKGYKIYALSNGDADTIKLYQKQYPAVMQQFDQVFYSAQTKKLKPSPDCFKDLLDTTGLAAENCYFFDDQMENVTAALKLDFKAYCATTKTMPQLLRAFQQHHYS